MVEFINKLTGSKMFVADDRAAEYKALGHIVASSVVDATFSEVPVEKKETPKKKKVKE